MKWFFEMAKKTLWTQEDDARLKAASSEDPPGSEGRWSRVAARLDNGKSAKECKARYEEIRSTLKRRKPEGQPFERSSRAVDPYYQALGKAARAEK